MWLLSKHRSADALKALQWLRGWVPPQNVHNEFHALKRYIKEANACLQCDKLKTPCEHPMPTFVEKIRDIFRIRTLKPAVIVLLVSIFAQFSGVISLKPYIVLTLNAYHTPMDPSWASVMQTIFSWVPRNSSNSKNISCFLPFLDNVESVWAGWLHCADVYSQIDWQTTGILNFYCRIKFVFFCNR